MDCKREAKCLGQFNWKWVQYEDDKYAHELYECYM